MLGSNSAGERDNAARMAEVLRCRHRLTRGEMIGLSPAAPEVIAEPVKPPPPAPSRAATPEPVTAASYARPLAAAPRAEWFVAFLVHSP
jgi:hypothetical protein